MRMARLRQMLCSSAPPLSLCLLYVASTATLSRKVCIECRGHYSVGAGYQPRLKLRKRSYAAGAHPKDSLCMAQHQALA